MGTPSEAATHQQICNYIRLNYPDVIFRSDYASGLKLSKYQSAMNKMLSSSRGYPDLFIAEPRGNYAGLFLELKREGVTIYLKRTGRLTSDPHVQEQAQVLQKLLNRGYRADFAIGYSDAVEKIDGYLALPKRSVAE